MNLPAIDLERFPIFADVLRAGVIAAPACVLATLGQVGSIGLRISASTEAWTLRA